jgi:hypothetical protein
MRLSKENERVMYQHAVHHEWKELYGMYHQLTEKARMRFYEKYILPLTVQTRAGCLDVFQTEKERLAIGI